MKENENGLWEGRKWRAGSSGRIGGDWLDLTGRGGADALSGILGNREVLMERFPLLAAAVVRAEKGGSEVVAGDTAVVDYMVYSNRSKTLTVHVLGFFRDYVTGVGIVRVVRENGELIVEKPFPIENEKFICRETVWDDFDVSVYGRERLKAQFAILDYCPDKALTGGVFEYTAEACELMDTIVDHIRVSDPVHKEDPGSDVRVIQARRSGNRVFQDSGYDYDYRDAERWLPEKKNELFMDFSGETVFSDPSMAFKGFLSGACDLWMYNDNDYAGYDMAGHEEFFRACFKAKEGGFTWNLNYLTPQPGEDARKRQLLNIDWQTVFPFVWVNRPVNFYFHGHFIYGKPGDPSTDKEGCFLLSSTLGGDETYKKKMPRILFHSGCLAGDTKIHMDDGSEKVISDIRPGERILSLHGIARRVEDVITGMEDRMYCIRVQGSGRYARVTDSHVMHTRRGLLPARLLKGDDEILTVDGSFRQVEEVFLGEGERIYNLLLEGGEEGSEMFADGLACGDFRMQNTVVYTEKKPDMPDGLKEEIRRLAEYLEKEGRHQ